MVACNMELVRQRRQRKQAEVADLVGEPMAVSVGLEELVKLAVAQELEVEQMEVADSLQVRSFPAMRLVLQSTQMTVVQK